MPLPPPPRSPRPLWLDCDPGHDDALAIVLALHSPLHCRMLGVSTVASNHSLEAVTSNAAAVLAACGGSSGDASVPLHAGADAPLFLPSKACPEIHGSSGLCVEGGSFAEFVRSRLRESGREELLLLSLPSSSSSSASSRKGPLAAVQAMAAAIEEAAAEIEREEAREKEEEEESQRQREAKPGEEETRQRRKRKKRPNVALVATGALTNVALLLWTRPDLVADKKFDLFIMGGAMGQGNTGVVAEFNLEVDPHAAAAVFLFGSAGAGRGLEITMVPLEVTHTALVSGEVLRRLGLEASEAERGDEGGEAALSPLPSSLPLSPLRAALRSLLVYFAETYSKHFGFDVGPPLHDPLAVLAAIFPPEEEDEEEEEGEAAGEEAERKDRQRRSPAFDLTRARVDIEVSSPLSLGQSVVDLRPRQLGRSKHLGEANAWVATKVDLGLLWGMLAAAIEGADAASPL